MDWAHDLAESLRNALLQLNWLAAWFQDLTRCLTDSW